MNTTEVAGTLHYQSPESLTGNNSGLPSDVYSFGMLLWEIVTLKKIHKQQVGGRRIGMGRSRSRSTTKEHYKHMIINRKWRPSLKSISSCQLRSLISKCWDDNPSKRPTFTQIRNELHNYISINCEVTTRRLSSLSLELEERSGESLGRQVVEETPEEGNDDQDDHQDHLFAPVVKHRRLRSMFLLRPGGHDQDVDKKAKKKHLDDDLTYYAGVSPRSHTTATISTGSISI